MGTERWRKWLAEEELEVYRRAGYLQRIGAGQRPALLVIDVEYNFAGDHCEPLLASIARYPDSCGPYAWETIPRIACLLGEVRKHRFPVVYTHGVERLDTTRHPRLGTAILDEVEPRPGELVLEKEAASAFFGTSLVRYLIGWGVDTLIHSGCATSGCVRATVVDAAAYGFKNVIVEDCVFDRAMGPHYANLFDMDAKYGDVLSLQTVQDYLSSLTRDSSID